MTSFLILDNAGYGKAFGKRLRESAPDVWICTSQSDAKDDPWNLKLPSTIDQLESLLAGSKFSCVIDSLVQVSETEHSQLYDLCQSLDIPYYRLLQNAPEEALYADTVEKALEVLAAATGNVLCTLPLEVLSPYVTPELTSRCYLITQPTVENLTRCRSLGFSAENLICLWGSLRRELITALLQKVEATVLLTHADNVTALQGAMDMCVTAVALGAPSIKANAYQGYALLKTLRSTFQLPSPIQPPPPFPLFIKRYNWKVRIFGGGSEALHWTRVFLEHQAAVTVIAPQLKEEFHSLPVDCVWRAYLQGDCCDCDLVLALTGNAHVNHAISAEAKAAGIPQHWRGHPASSDFILPEILKKDGCTLALYDPEHSKKRLQALQNAL